MQARRHDRGYKGNNMLIQNLKRFFEVKAGIERIDEQIKELKEDKKATSKLSKT